MTKPRRISRLAAAMLWLAPGATVLGSSCARELRDSLIDTGVGFVGDTASDLLYALFPVGDWLAGAAQAQ